MGDTIFIAWEDSRPENGDQSIYAVRSTDGGISWEEPYWVDANPYGSWNPSIACSNGKAYLIWYDRQWPDSSGLYFSRFNLEPDAVKNEDYNLPDKISLVAYPNPFNSSVNINYSSKKGGEIKIYNTSGQFIRSLKVAAAEDGKATWDGTDSNGKRAVSGTYIMKFLSEGLSKTVKLIYLK